MRETFPSGTASPPSLPSFGKRQYAVGRFCITEPFGYKNTTYSRKGQIFLTFFLKKKAFYTLFL